MLVDFANYVRICSKSTNTLQSYMYLVFIRTYMLLFGSHLLTYIFTHCERIYYHCYNGGVFAFIRIDAKMKSGGVTLKEL